MRSTRQADHSNAVFRYFAAKGNLTDTERDELNRLLHFVRQHTPNTELCTQGEVQQPRILLTGWACQQQVLRTGRRQIIRFLLPGDFIGSLECPLQPAMSAVVALTLGTLADARSLLQAVHEPNETNRGLATLVRSAVRAEEAGLRDHIVRLGGRTAYERVVHLILELHSRLQEVGLAEANSFVMPLTQESIADALGISFVHTNRTLQQVKRDGLFGIRAGLVTIQNLGEMRRIAEWQDD